MKLCLLGDTHFGARNDSKHFHDYFEAFYLDFFQYLNQHGIKQIVQLGDLFDRRKYINFYTLAESKRYFFDKLIENGIELHALIGNHDIFWRNRLDVNSPELLLSDYANIHVYGKPTTVQFDSLAMDMIPWMTFDNLDQITKFIDASVSPVCVGHFELAGFPLMKGVESHDGVDSKFLDRYDRVFSGHYHTQSSKGNIVYTGTPYEMIWSDYKDPKGFFIFDTETLEYEFIQNRHRIFHKLFYDDSKYTIEDVMQSSYAKLQSKYVKIVVVKKENPYIFDKMLDQIHKVSPIDITIVEDFSELNTDANDAEMNQTEDTLTSLYNFIDQQSLQSDPNRLKNIMRELYLEALSVENVE